MPFTFEKQSIKDVILITPKVFGDNRGFFMETYKKSDFEANGIMGEFNQDNHSKSTKGVLRGLHFQKQPYAQAKIVRCLKGRIYDVAVDIRKGSKTFGKYVKVELSEENKKIIDEQYKWWLYNYRKKAAGANSNIRNILIEIIKGGK